jgi:hypothetical protein
MRTDKIQCWLLVATLLPLFFGLIALRAQAQQEQDAAPSRPNGHYLESLLKEPNAEAPCPPGIDPLYQANVIVTGTDMRQRPWGFAQTLRTVLVKSSGDPRLKDDPRLADLTAHADTLVLCFSYADMMAGIPLHDDQGTYDRPHKLTVTFDPAKIDAILAQFGDKPWRGTRPVIVPVILVHGPKPPPYLLNAETPRGLYHLGQRARHEAPYSERCGARRLEVQHRSSSRRPAAVGGQPSRRRRDPRLERHLAGLGRPMAVPLAWNRPQLEHPRRQL